MIDHDMTYEALAQRAVRAGILERLTDGVGGNCYGLKEWYPPYGTQGRYPPWHSAHAAVTDGRVILAAMEKCRRKLSVEQWCRLMDSFKHFTHESECAAPILTACLDALEGE